MLCLQEMARASSPAYLDKMGLALSAEKIPTAPLLGGAKKLSDWSAGVISHMEASRLQAVQNAFLRLGVWNCLPGGNHVPTTTDALDPVCVSLFSGIATGAVPGQGECAFAAADTRTREALLPAVLNLYRSFVPAPGLSYSRDEKSGENHFVIAMASLVFAIGPDKGPQKLADALQHMYDEVLFRMVNITSYINKFIMKAEFIEHEGLH